MRILKPEISDEKIIELYQQGWSQKDITQKHKVPVTYLRKVLKNAGYKTHSYRSLSDTKKDIISACVHVGLSAKQIEDYFDISFYAIREVVEKRNLRGISTKFRLENPDYDKVREEVNISTLNEIIKIYTEGKIGLVSIFTSLNITPNEMVKYLPYLREHIDIHKESLEENVLSLYSKEFPMSVIAKQMGISRSIVKDIINGHIAMINKMKNKSFTKID